MTEARKRTKGEGRWKRLTQRAPSWTLSLAGHLMILVVFAMITWIVVEARQRDRLLTLAGEDVVSDIGAGSDGLAGGQGARPAEGAPDRQAAEAMAPAAMPPPEALSITAAELIQPAQPDQLLVGGADATKELMRSLAAAGAGGGKGQGLFPGAGSNFGKMLRGLRKTGLDVVLVLDATDSMSPYIEQAKKRLQQVIDVVTFLVPPARFGVVAYKDYGDEYGPNAVKVMRVSPDSKAVRQFINDIVAGGGADEPEPIDEALAVVVNTPKMGWQPGRKWVVILAGDSSIHPSGREPAFRDAQTFAQRLRGTINVIDVGGTGAQGAQRQAVKPDLARIAQAGGGSAFLLKDQEAFWRHLIISVFGESYEQDVNTIIEMFVQEK